MQVKMFEVRDRHTHIPVIAVNFENSTEPEKRLLGRAGFGTTDMARAHYVMLYKTNQDFGTTDPFNWPGSSRTMREAHIHLQKHFNELETGAVIDIEFILGETPTPKLSEN